MIFKNLKIVEFIVLWLAQNQPPFSDTNPDNHDWLWVDFVKLSEFIFGGGREGFNIMNKNVGWGARLSRFENRPAIL